MSLIYCNITCSGDFDNHFSGLIWRMGVVSSGYSNDPVLANFRQYGFSSFVAKPYKVEELSKTLREVIMGTSE